MFSCSFNLNVDNTVSVVSSPLRFKSKKKLSRFSWSINETKLKNNLSRAKTNCFNIALNNQFNYFFTQTIDSKYSRTDLNSIINKFRTIIKKVRFLYPEKNFFYLIIPELHEDNMSWHLHGLLSADFVELCYKNVNGFESLSHFNELGYNSISLIKNYSACCRYILKYITKNTQTILTKNQHLYYCSKGLKRSNIINKITCNYIPPLHFDFKSEYCFKTTINIKKYYNLITSIDNLNRFYYI